jgi:hypothetical protein
MRVDARERHSKYSRVVHALYNGNRLLGATKASNFSKKCLAALSLPSSRLG